VSLECVTKAQKGLIAEIEIAPALSRGLEAVRALSSAQRGRRRNGEATRRCSDARNGQPIEAFAFWVQKCTAMIRAETKTAGRTRRPRAFALLPRGRATQRRDRSERESIISPQAGLVTDIPYIAGHRHSED
jgi:hypothetical protein